MSYVEHHLTHINQDDIPSLGLVRGNLYEIDRGPIRSLYGRVQNITTSAPYTSLGGTFVNIRITLWVDDVIDPGPALTRGSWVLYPMVVPSMQELIRVVSSIGRHAHWRRPFEVIGAVGYLRGVHSDSRNPRAVNLEIELTEDPLQGSGMEERLIRIPPRISVSFPPMASQRSANSASFIQAFGGDPLVTYDHIPLIENSAPVQVNTRYIETMNFDVSADILFADPSQPEVTMLYGDTIITVDSAADHTEADPIISKPVVPEFISVAVEWWYQYLIHLMAQSRTRLMYKMGTPGSTLAEKQKEFRRVLLTLVQDGWKTMSETGYYSMSIESKITNAILVKAEIQGVTFPPTTMLVKLRSVQVSKGKQPFKTVWANTHYGSTELILDFS